MKTESYALQAHGVDDRRRRLLTAVRAIVAAASHPEVHLSVPGLAEASGLSEGVVQELLTSDEYMQMVEDTAKRRIATVLQKAITRIEELVEHDKPAIALEAIRGATTLYRTMNQAHTGHRQAQSRADTDQLLRELELMGRLKQGQVRVVPTPNP